MRDQSDDRPERLSVHLHDVHQLPAGIMASAALSVDTRPRGFVDITGEVQRFVQEIAAEDGILFAYLRHTSASLVIQENADPDVRHDLERFFARLVPDGDSLYRHVAEGEDDMPAHVRTALTAVNLSIPLANGQLALGTWQGIYLWEHRRGPHRRTIAVHLIGD